MPKILETVQKKETDISIFDISHKSLYTSLPGGEIGNWNSKVKKLKSTGGQHCQTERMFIIFPRR